MNPMIRPRHLIAATAIATATTLASADVTGVYVVRYTVTAEDFGGTEVTMNVADLYLSSDDAADTVLNVYNTTMPDAGKVSYFQSFTGTGWLPGNLGGPFDTAALRSADSFVTIGGFDQKTCYPKQTPSAGGGTGLDPNFGGYDNAYPGNLAGWYNSSPPNLNGQVGQVCACDGGFTLGVLVGRFAYGGCFSLSGLELEVTWNQGLGTSGRQAGFLVLEECFMSGDCNDNGISDTCDIADGLADDCNANGISDECDVADLANDYNQNGVPDECEGGLVGTDFATIAEALIEAPDGGVVRVPAGTYDEAVVLDRGVFLIAIDGPDQTTLTRSGAAGPAIVADGAVAGTVISGFTIANAANFATDGGGGIDATNSNLLVDDCIIEGNGATDGGGARFEGGAPTLRNCRFRGNVSQGVGGGLRLVGADATVESCTFELNVAAEGALGWAIAATDGFPTFTDVEARFHDGQPVALESLAGFPNTIMAADRLFIHDNIGRGLVFLGDDPQSTTLVDSRICGNTDQPTDGAYTDLGENILFTDRCPDLVVPDDADTIQLAIDTALDGERIAVRPGTYDEGGISLAGRDLELVGIEDLFLAKPDVTGPIDASGMPDTGLIRYFAITNGTGVVDLPGYRGLAVGGGLVLDDSRLLVQDCDVFDNQADLGGGIFIREGAVVLSSVYIAQNASTTSGGGLWVEGGVSTTLEIDGGLIAANEIPMEAGSRGGGIDARGLADAMSLSLGDTAISGNVRENLAQNTASGSYTDLGGNSISPAFDCNENGREDAADIEDFGAVDCNQNLVPDACDITTGFSDDCNGNGIPDACDLGFTTEPIYERHDGTSEKAEGAEGPGTLAWMERFTGRANLSEIRSISVTFGESGLSPAIIGRPVTVCLWSDPDGDGTPNDAEPIVIVDAVIDGPLGTSAQLIELPGSVTVGVGSNFFVGVVMTLPPDAGFNFWYPAAIDESGGSLDSWIARDADLLSPADVGSAEVLERLAETDPKFATSRWMITAVPSLTATEFDCNANGLIDACETADGTSVDCDGNQVPDECDIANGAPDANLDGIPDGCQDQLVFEVPARFKTITAAIDAATDGSRIELAPGNYAEAIDLGSKNLELIGNRANPESTTIETPGMNMTVVTIAGGQDASTLIAGVLIENGISDTPEPGFPSNNVGGGLYIDGSSPTIEDCIVGTNQATRGGGAYLRFSETAFRRTIFEGNVASGGGGGIWWIEGVITLEECTIRDNQTEGDGGGLHLATDDGSITGGSITGNLATNNGAGLWWQGSSATLLLLDIEVSMNIAGGTGGGVYSQSGFIGIEPAGLVACDNAPNQVRGPYTVVSGVTNTVCRCGDISGDGEVNGVDLGLYLAVGGTACEDFEDCPADITFDGVITGADLGRILGDWGFCP